MTVSFYAHCRTHYCSSHWRSHASLLTIILVVVYNSSPTSYGLFCRGTARRGSLPPAPRFSTAAGYRGCWVLEPHGSAGSTLHRGFRRYGFLFPVQNGRTGRCLNLSLYLLSVTSHADELPLGPEPGPLRPCKPVAGSSESSYVPCSSNAGLPKMVLSKSGIDIDRARPTGPVPGSTVAGAGCC